MRPTPIVTLARLHEQADRLVRNIATPNAFAEVVDLGLRRADIVEALESTASDPAIPAGTLETISETTAITRARALFARVELGVGSTSLARVIDVAGKNDPSVADVALAPIDPDPRAAVRRLLARLPRTESEGARLGGFFVRTLVLTAIDRVLAQTRDQDLHDAAADGLAAWVREAGLGTGGPRALPKEVLVTMLERVGSLDSARWPAALHAMLDDGELADRVLARRWLGARSMRASVRREPCATPLRVSAICAPPSAFTELDELLRRAPEGAGLPSWAIYDVVHAAAPELWPSDWERTCAWPPAARCAAVDAILEGEVSELAASAAMDQLLRSAPRTFERLRSPLVALARRATARWGAFVEGLAESLNAHARARAADLAVQTMEGLAVLELLDRLALDPARPARVAARAARGRLRAVADQRHAARLLLLAAARGELAPSRVTRVTRSIDAAELVRRTRRTARRIGLSPEAIAFVDDALPLTRDTLIGSAAHGQVQLIATNGRRLDTAVLFERESTSDRIALASAKETSHFVACAPSSFFRLVREGHADRAVQVGANLDVRAADPRLLGLVI